MSERVEDFVELPEAASFLGYPSAAAMRVAMSRGNLDSLRAYRKGSGRTARWVFRKADLLAFIDSQRGTVGELRHRD